ncbi:hypothetical protein J7E97_20925 [Streptomyces sp. ISL-66]|uniref:hypothetical protein n=1 Tax=Streptomyces sp. ISL-66 TaxID=2819186 RepID=UPI001BECBCE4|nr:hypothetical protein [Streptomyces sp. ISL-66]MBT2470269.1 hypothetical protein [Streptomyces sp. ISL-66]
MTNETRTTSFWGTDNESFQEEPAPSVTSVGLGEGRGVVTISSLEYERIQAAAELCVYAERRGLRLVRADGPNGHLVSQALVLADILLLPLGRHPRDALLDLRAGSGVAC